MRIFHRLPGVYHAAALERRPGIIPSLRSSLLPLTPVLICSLPRCLSPATRRPIRRIATGRCRVITWRCLSKIAATGQTLFYAPGWVEPDETLLPWLQKADCLPIDGTVWQDDELQAAGVAQYRARYGLPGARRRARDDGLMASLPAKRKNSHSWLITPTRSLTSSLPAPGANATGSK